MVGGTSKYKTVRARRGKEKNKEHGAKPRGGGRAGGKHTSWGEKKMWLSCRKPGAGLGQIDPTTGRARS